MADKFSALILDDGELADIREILEEMDVEVVHQKTTQRPKKLGGNHDLVFTSGSCASVSRAPGSDDDTGARPVWIAAHGQDFLPLRQRLRVLGVDSLIAKNVSRQVLRIVIRDALFRGGERRNTARIPVGSTVTWRSGGKHFQAVLAEISLDGCRLIGAKQPHHRSMVEVELPASLGAGRPIRIPGRAVRLQTPDGDQPNEFAVEFCGQTAGYKRLLAQLRSGVAIGSRVTQLSEPKARIERAAQSPDATARGSNQARTAAQRDEPIAALRKERRQTQRSKLAGRPLILLGDDLYTVHGKDLSTQGIRIERAGELTIGESVSVAIPGSTGEKPTIVQGTVSRDDGIPGMALRFDTLSPDTRRSLERIITHLPPVTDSRD